MIHDWSDRVHKQVEKDYEEGRITAEECDEEHKGIEAELEEEARENAQNAYNETMGY